MFASTSVVLLPGEQVPSNAEKEDEEKGHDEVAIGPGLIQGNFARVNAVKAGVLLEQQHILYLDTSQKRYYPQIQEPIIGVVEGKMGDGYKVGINSSFSAFLDSLAFEGATKRNKPNLTVGSIVYGRIVIANRDMDPEMSCVAVSGKSEGFGELSISGALVQVGLNLARSLMSSSHPILTGFASVAAFELIVGLNGLLWIKADSVKATQYLGDLIRSADGLSPQRQEALIKRYLQNFKKSLNL